ncbi:MAG: HAD family hydrolase [Planctomycetota bacterium]
MRGIRGIVFDLGNTLVPFGRAEFARLRDSLAGFLASRLPGADPLCLRRTIEQVETRLSVERERTLTESDPGHWIQGILSDLGAPLDASIVRGALELLHREFVNLIRVPPEVPPLLEGLARRFSLALLSNYWMVEPIHEALHRNDLARHFKAVLVSAELGVVKPHPALFREVLARLGLSAGEVLFVGDNRAADIAGAAALGMRTALTLEHAALAEERDQRGANGIIPDLLLPHLVDIDQYL